MSAERPDVAQSIGEAIAAQAVIELVYEDAGAITTRVCWPHVLYEDGTGTLLVELYQVGGATSGRLPAWRCFEVDRVREVRTRDETFDPAPGYNPLNRERYVRPLRWIGQLRSL
jgi:predicted DNA-binding transcriptional regulator YafY